MPTITVLMQSKDFAIKSSITSSNKLIIAPKSSKMLEALQNFVTSANTGYRNFWQERKESNIVSPILSHLPQYSLAEVAEHYSTEDCWIVVCDRVYDVTGFLDSHPGGYFIIMEHAGRDATLVFRGSRHSDDAVRMLDQYLIGVLIEVSELISTKLFQIKF